MTGLTLEARLRNLEDIEAIKQLKAAYCNTLDGGWPEKGPSHMGSIGDLFVEDGVWDGRPHAPLAQGRDAIVRMVQDYRVVPFIMHLALNPVIEVDGDSAKGHWHVIVPNTHPDGSGSMTLGTYDEVYVRTPDGWKFKSLRFIAATITPYEPSWFISTGASAAGQ